MEFDSLARYTPTHVSSMSDKIHRYIMGLDSYYADSCLVMAAYPRVDIARIQAHAQGMEGHCRGRQMERTEGRQRGLGRPVPLQNIGVNSFRSSSRVAIFLDRQGVYLRRPPTGDPLALASQGKDQIPAASHDFSCPYVHYAGKDTRGSASVLQVPILYVVVRATGCDIISKGLA